MTVLKEINNNKKIFSLSILMLSTHLALADVTSTSTSTFHSRVSGAVLLNNLNSSEDESPQSQPIAGAMA